MKLSVVLLYQQISIISKVNHTQKYNDTPNPFQLHKIHFILLL